MNKRIILTLLGLVLCIALPAKNLKGAKLPFTYADTIFKNPFIDVDKTIKTPVVCRYIHGGFDDGTRFSFYFPIEKEDYTGRFFQYITPFPDSETSAQASSYELSPIRFSIEHGAYFVETNEGGAIDLSRPDQQRERTIGAYRANAACAEFSRVVAKAIYDCPRPYGYCYGGSGGAYRTTGGVESTEGVWDGSVPFVLGSPHAIPNVFGVRMNALRVLRDKMADIVDALEPGGSGNPYATLNAEQRQVLQEATRMGFPIKAWYGWRYMDAHGFLVLYRTVVGADPTYFNEDFWNKPGYLGYDNPASLARDHVQTQARVTRILGQAEAESLGLVEPMNEADRGTADRAWASMGSELKDKPVAYEIDQEVEMHTMGGDLIILSGTGEGQRLQITEAKGRYVTLANVNTVESLTYLKVGDRVQVDNSNWLACETYYRHQMPTPDFYAWNQFRGYLDQPVYPQRPMLLGPMFTMGAAGCLPTGSIHGKMILCCSVWDREAFAWQGDWYRKHVEEYLGNAAEDNFRLWYTDRATHGETDDPTEVVSYQSTLFQALLDISDWAERGIAPSRTSDYEIDNGQVVLSNNGNARGGIQAVVKALINGNERADVRPGESVTVHVSIDVPKGTGRVVKADWCLDDSKEFTLPVNLSEAKVSADGEHMEFDTNLSYAQTGTYFPTLRVFTERHGDANADQTFIPNLGKVRVVVK